MAALTSLLIYKIVIRNAALPLSLIACLALPKKQALWPRDSFFAYSYRFIKMTGSFSLLEACCSWDADVSNSKGASTADHKWRWSYRGMFLTDLQSLQLQSLQTGQLGLPQTNLTRTSYQSTSILQQ